MSFMKITKKIVTNAKITLYKKLYLVSKTYPTCKKVSFDINFLSYKFHISKIYADFLENIEIKHIFNINENKYLANIK